MACRIGITTDLSARKAYWESVCTNLRDWQVLAGPFKSKAEAQNEENRLAQKHRCDSAPGGDDPEDPNAEWWVYGFNHDGCSQ